MCPLELPFWKVHENAAFFSAHRVYFRLYSKGDDVNWTRRFSIGRPVTAAYIYIIHN